MTDRDFLSGLELSVRATNALRAAGVSTMADFMGLEQEAVLRMRNAGRRTAQEVAEAQAGIRKRTLTAEESDQVREALSMLNNWIIPRRRRYSFAVTSEGLIQLNKRIL